MRGQDLNNRPPVTTSAGWMLPNMIKLHVRLPLGDLIIYDTNIPIDETHTLVKWVALRTFFTGKWADKNAIQRTLKIFYEDAEVVDKVRPELLPFDLGAELHIRSDLIAVQYRRRRQELAEKGWLLSDDDKITGDVPRRTATVIPSLGPPGEPRAGPRLGAQGARRTPDRRRRRADGPVRRGDQMSEPASESSTQHPTNVIAGAPAEAMA
nr:hypothetical protein GCM10020092_035890 [Actinoplanes digitatis]